MNTIITTAKLSKKYKDTFAVDNVALNIPKGMIYGFLGPNGAGKSTTLKMILGLIKPNSGIVNVFGQEMNNENKISILKDIGSLIESPSYYGHLNGYENLEIVSILKNVPKKDINRVLQIVRLDKQKNKKVSQYSLGMKQRLGLACALLGNPKLLILDEPTNGLDPSGIQEIRALIKSLPKKLGMTVIISSHLLSEIDQIADYVGIINKGKLIFQESLTKLRQQAIASIAVRTLNNSMAKKIFEKNKVACEINDNYLIVPKVSDKDLAGCINQLCKENIGVVRIEERCENLEDIFLKLTDKGKSL